MKVIKIFSLLLILLVVGCGKKEYMTCNIEVNNNIENYKQVSTYKVYYKNNYVNKIEKEDEYKSNNKNTIEYLKELNSLLYYDLSDKYGGVIYDINTSDDTIKIKSTIDLESFDIKKYASDDKIDDRYVVGRKLLKSGIKKIYEEKGATCK